MNTYEDMIEYAESSTEAFEQVIKWARLHKEGSKLKDKTLHTLAHMYCVDEGINFKRYKLPVYDKASHSITDTNVAISNHFLISESI